MATAKTNYIWVMGAVRGKKSKRGLRPGQLALHQIDKRHPYDELSNENRIFVVAGEAPVQAYLTPEVAEKIRTGELRQVTAAEAKKLGGVPAPPNPAKPVPVAPPDDEDEDEEEDESNDESDDEE